jgi:hypothetical protein
VYDIGTGHVSVFDAQERELRSVERALAELA